jgi:hypothetical protein
MPFIFEAATIALIVSNVVLWHQFHDRNFLFFAILGIPPLMAFLLHIFGRTYFGLSPLFSFILFFGAFGAMCWYTWRKFGDKTSMVALLLNLFGVIAVAYTIMVR